jgi:hypothetical protein
MHSTPWMTPEYIECESVDEVETIACRKCGADSNAVDADAAAEKEFASCGLDDEAFLCRECYEREVAFMNEEVA